MTVFLTLLLVALMIGVLVALVRGIIAFLKTTEADLKSGGTGPSASGLAQNKAMFSRIMFQGAAIVIVVLLLLMKRG